MSKNNETNKQNTRPTWHNGYIVTLNTLARFFSDTKEDVGSYVDEVREMEKNKKNQPNTYLTFGEFDRITFNGVDRFSRFFDLDERSKYWLGKHQSVFIYQIEPNDSGPRIYPYTLPEEEKEGTQERENIVSDFGICINKSEDNWYLFSSKYCLNTVYQNQKVVFHDSFFPFFVFTQISLSNEALTRISNFTEFIKILRAKLLDQLDTIIKEKGCRIEYEIFGCLNTSEICILWMTKQYTDVLALIDELKNVKFSIHLRNGKETEDTVIGHLFFSFYSVIGRMLSNDIILSEEYNQYKEKMDDCNGIAQIDIVLNNECSVVNLQEELLKELNLDINNSRIRVGEHDFSIQLPAKSIYNLFQEVRLNSDKNGVFKKQNIREKILGTRVVLSVETKERIDGISFNIISFDDNILRNSSDIVRQFAQLREELDPFIKVEKGDRNPLDTDNTSPRIREMYLWLRMSLKDRFASHTGSVDTLDMLYTDYLSNIHESYNALWRNDYNYQFKRSLQFLITVLESTRNEEDQDITFWNYYTLIIDSIRQQTIHFSQSSRLVMRIPSSHLRYTACCDMMFHGYYGLVKAILLDAYKKQEEGFNQSELVPIITTNSHTNIQSRLFFVGPNFADIRIVQIDIPYSLLYDPIIGFPYMVHEMFHYIAPSDRCDRNNVLGHMFVNEILTRLYMEQIEEKLKKYFYEEISSNIDFNNIIKHRYNNNQELSFTSVNDTDYDKFFKKMLKSFEGVNGTYSALSSLNSNLRETVWYDETISSIRKSIVESITDNTDKSIRFATWNTFLENLLKAISELSFSVYEKISGSLLDRMNKYENQLLGQETQENLCICSSDQCFKMNEIDQILYSHKIAILNPRNITRADKYSTTILSLNEMFINGLREATPDIAMVKYCHMDNVTYLVYYARQIDINVEKTFAFSEILRIPLVLIWNSKKDIIDSDGAPQKFDFENEEFRFVKEYMAENLQQNQDSEKLVDLVTDAIVWFCRFIYIAAAFRNEYLCYYDEIIRYGQSYDVYYSKGEETKREPVLDSLVKIFISRKSEKIQYRSELLSKEQWDQIESICKGVVGTYDSLSLPNRKEVRKIVEGRLTGKGLNSDLYVAKNKIYNNRSFASSLNFAHQATNQITFEKLAKTIKRSSNSVGEELVSEKTEKKSNPLILDESIEVQLNQRTSSIGWSMAEYVSGLQKAVELFKKYTPKSSIWYYASVTNKEVIPTVADLSSSDPIHLSVSNDFYKYHEAHRDIISQSLGIPKMTIDRRGEWKSNLVPWKGSLIDSLSPFTSITGDINLYMFSPQKYLRARRYVLSNHATYKKIAPYKKLNITTLPLICNKDELEDKHGYYILHHTTSDKMSAAEEDFNISPDPGDYHLPYILPMPFNFNELESNSRFLAYNLALPSRKSTGSSELEYAIYPIEKIQSILIKQIQEIWKKRNNKPFIPEIWAFLYKIVINGDIAKSAKYLISFANLP